MKDWTLCAILVVIVTGWLVACTKTSSLEALIDYRRSGGLLGVDDHLVINKNGETLLLRRSERYEFTLNEDSISHLQALFEEAEFSQLGTEHLPPRQVSDSFEYVVTYGGYTVQARDGAVPPSLWAVLEALNQIVETQRDP
jgi:hypothetical protein